VRYSGPQTLPFLRYSNFFQSLTRNFSAIKKFGRLKWTLWKNCDKSSEIVNLVAVRLLPLKGGEKYIEQSRCFDENQYIMQPTTKLLKIVSLAFLLFLQRVTKNGKNANTACC